MPRLATRLVVLTTIVVMALALVMLYLEPAN